MKIYVTDHDGVEHEVNATDDWPVMECIKAAGLALPAECGGCCLCATCHVYVDDEWLARVPDKDGDEDMTLGEAAMLQDNSRLSCQIRMTADLNGLRVRLAPMA